MYILDTSIVSTFLDRRRNNPYLRGRVLSQPAERLFISVITIEEIMRGELAAIHRIRQKPNVVALYREFEDLFAALHRFQVLSYTNETEQIYRSMTAVQQRVGTQDCRIAATAISLGFVIVTANTTDFHKIGNVAVEDWTINPNNS